MVRCLVSIVIDIIVTSSKPISNLLECTYSVERKNTNDNPIRNESINVAQAKSIDIVSIEINGVASINPRVIGRIHNSM